MKRIQITDLERVSREATLERVARMGGPDDVVLVRDPQITGAELVAWARALRTATREVGAQLWVNDRLDVAACADADGVHLGRRSIDVADARVWLGPAATISLSAHAMSDVARAVEVGADVALLSPIFASPGKTAPLGLEALKTARATVRGSRTQVVALGGVDAATARTCLEAGAHGVAAIRADLSRVAR